MKTAFTHELWPQGANVSSQILWTQTSFTAGTEIHPNTSGVSSEASSEADVHPDVKI